MMSVKLWHVGRRLITFIPSRSSIIVPFGTGVGGKSQRSMFDNSEPTLWPSVHFSSSSSASSKRLSRLQQQRGLWELNEHVTQNQVWKSRTTYVMINSGETLASSWKASGELRQQKVYFERSTEALTGQPSHSCWHTGEAFKDRRKIHQLLALTKAEPALQDKTSCRCASVTF